MPAFNRAASRPGAAKSKDKAEGDEAADRAAHAGARDQTGASERTGGAAGDAGGTDHFFLIRACTAMRKLAGVGGLIVTVEAAGRSGIAGRQK
jgi:hypothetical protein